MKVWQDLHDEKAWQKCQAGHEKHDRILVDTELGKMWVWDYEKYKGFDGYCTGQDDISRTLINNGIWEVTESKIIREVLENGDRSKGFVDIGAHIGWYSLMASQLGYQVMAIEADSENCELIKANAELHNIKIAGTKAPEITIYNTWVGEETTPVPFRDKTLVKCDIEGNEQYAVVMCEKLLKRGGAENLFFEISPVFNDSYPAVVEKILSYGYEAFLDDKPFDGKFDFNQENILFRKVKK